MVHPFLWNTLLSPLHLHGTVYPAFRTQYENLASGFDNSRYLTHSVSLLNSPMFSHNMRFFREMDLAQCCGLGLLVVSLVMILVNSVRNVRHLTVWIGSTAFALIAIQELAAASLVAAIIASLNGQAWYARVCKRDYLVTTRNVLWSRGGRAVTVLGLTALAFFGGTGRLRNSDLVGQTGVGLDFSLLEMIRGLQDQLQKDESFDDRPFNTTGRQGDVLIWIGQKVFADSRLGLYYGPNDETNLLTQQLQLRLRFLGMPPLKRPESPGSSSATAPVAEGAKSTVKPFEWKEIFDKYKVTHIVPDLAGNQPDYGIMYLAFYDPTWRPTNFGGASLIMYRTDLKDPELQTYLKSRKVDFAKLTYKTEEPAVAVRDVWVKPPSFYQQYFWAERKQSPLEIQEARHLIRFARDLIQNSQMSGQNVNQSLELGTSLALLGIRRAQTGLAIDPNCTDGYVAMGVAYAILNGTESPSQQSPEGYAPTIRYYQAVAAFNQALIADPTNQVSHEQLRLLYLGPHFLQARALEYQLTMQKTPPSQIPRAEVHLAIRPDLALRETNALYRLLKNERRLPPELVATRDGLKHEIDMFEETLKPVRERLAFAAADSAQARTQKVRQAVEMRCFLLALDLMEKDPDGDTSPDYSMVRPELQLEAGLVEQAHQSLSEFANETGNPQYLRLVRPIAISRTTNADYHAASEVLEKTAIQLDKMTLVQLLETLTFKPGPSSDTSKTRPWPLTTIQMGFAKFYPIPDHVGRLWLDNGLLQLEAGKLADAAESFRNSLSYNPNATYAVLVARYLYYLTGERIRMNSELNEIQPEFMPEPAPQG